MSIVWIIAKTQGANNYARMAGNSNGYFRAEHILFMLFSFADSVRFGFMQAVDFSAIVPFLLQHLLKQQ
jgi:hypothetical protein